jgi:hypothetical protein
MHHYLMSEDDQKKPLLDFLSDRTAITNMLLRTPTSDGKFRIACMNKVLSGAMICCSLLGVVRTS